MQRFWKMNARLEQGGKSYFYEFAKYGYVAFEKTANKINSENLGNVDDLVLICEDENPVGIARLAEPFELRLLDESSDLPKEFVEENGDGEMVSEKIILRKQCYRYFVAGTCSRLIVFPPELSEIASALTFPREAFAEITEFATQKFMLKIYRNFADFGEPTSETTGTLSDILDYTTLVRISADQGHSSSISKKRLNFWVN